MEELSNTYRCFWHLYTRLRLYGLIGANLEISKTKPLQNRAAHCTGQQSCLDSSKAAACSASSATRHGLWVPSDLGQGYPRDCSSLLSVTGTAVSKQMHWRCREKALAAERSLWGCPRFGWHLPSLLVCQPSDMLARRTCCQRHQVVCCGM